MGVKVPRSSYKRCALQEEHVKRVKIEEQYKESQEKIQKLEKKVGDISYLVKLLMKHQVILYISYRSFIDLS